MTTEKITFVLRARNDAKRAIDALRRSLGEVDGRGRSSKNEAKRLANNLANAAREGRQLVVQSQKADDAIRGVARGSQRAEEGLKGAAAAAGTLAATAGAARASLLGIGAASAGALGVGVGLTAGLGAAVTVAASFEQQLDKVRAVASLTVEEARALEEAARDAGATTQFSATQAAEGLEFLARAGFDATESVQGLPVALGLAQAEGLALGRAADIASNVLSAFRLETEEFARVGDVLARTAASANTNVEQLGQAFKFVAPDAAAANVSLEETAAVIGTLSNSGIQGALAGTRLRAAITRLAKPTREAQKVLDAVGLSVEDVDIAARGLRPVLADLAEANLSTAEAAAIFGTEASGGIRTLLNSLDTYDELVRKNKDAEGSLRALGIVATDNLAGAFKELVSAVQEFFIAVTNNEALTTFVRFLTALVRELTPARDLLKDTGTAAKGAADFMKETEERAAELVQQARELREIAAEVIDVVQNLGIVLAAVFGARVIGNIAKVVAGLRTAASVAKFSGLVLRGHPLILLLTTALTLLGNLRGSFLDFAAEVGDINAKGVDQVKTALDEVNKSIKKNQGIIEANKFSISPFSLVGAGVGNLAEDALERDLRTREQLRARLAALTSTSGSVLGVGDIRLPGASDGSGGTGEPSTLRGIELGGASGSAAAAADVLAGLREEVDLLRRAQGLLGAERERAIEVQRLLNEAERNGQEISREDAAALVTERDRLAARNEIAQRLRDTVDSLREERDLIGLTSQQREVATTILRAEQDARRLGIELRGEEIDLIRREIELTQRARGETGGVVAGVRAGLRSFAEDARTTAEFARDTTIGFLDDVNRAIGDLVTTGKANWRELFSSLLGEISSFLASSLFRQFTQAIDGGLGGGTSGGSGGSGGGRGALGGLLSIGASALAAAFGGGGASALSLGGGSGGLSFGGGVGTSSPPINTTLFGADGGLIRGPGSGRADILRAGVSDGEYLVNSRATRANLALLNDINSGAGRPVRAQSSTSGAPVQNISVTMNLSGVRDADSFRRSRGQIEAEAGAAISRAAQRNN